MVLGQKGHQTTSHQEIGWGFAGQRNTDEKDTFCP
jgi:hypothetical protein